MFQEKKTDSTKRTLPSTSSQPIKIPKIESKEENTCPNPVQISKKDGEVGDSTYIEKGASGSESILGLDDNDESSQQDSESQLEFSEEDKKVRKIHFLFICLY